jgi:hypothetical protein
MILEILAQTDYLFLFQKLGIRGWVGPRARLDAWKKRKFLAVLEIDSQFLDHSPRNLLTVTNMRCS